MCGSLSSWIYNFFIIYLRQIFAQCNSAITRLISWTVGEDKSGEICRLECDTLLMSVAAIIVVTFHWTLKGASVVKSRESCEAIASDFSPARCCPELFSSVSVTPVGFVPPFSHPRKRISRRGNQPRESSLHTRPRNWLIFWSYTWRVGCCCTICFASIFRCASWQGTTGECRQYVR